MGKIKRISLQVSNGRYIIGPAVSHALKFMPNLGRREFLLTAAGTLAWAQDATFSSRVDVVNVPVSVRDKHGRFVSDLNSEDFAVDEDGRPQSLRYFDHQGELALTLGLLVDVSSSQINLIGTEQRASVTFFNQVLREDRDQAFLYRFYRRVEMLSHLSQSRRDLESALQGLDDPYEIEGAATEKSRQRPAQFDGTALYDAVQVPVDTIMKMRRGRKALILLSDGVDTASSTSLWRAIEGAQRADTLIYSLCYADRDSDRRDQARGAGVLRALAEQTGGRYFKISREQSLDEVYSLIQDELRNQYNLGYIPASDGPAYRKLRVSVNRKGLTVQSRDGYYRGA